MLSFFSLKLLVVQIALILYFAYIMGEPVSQLLLLFLFSVQIVLLKISMNLKNAEAFRIGILLLLTVSVLLYAGTLQMEHPAWDARHFFKDVQSLRQGQSPYSGELSCGMNQNFVPTFALCAALGNSFDEFLRNLTWVNAGSAVVCIPLIGIGLFYFFRKRKLQFPARLEICLAATILGAIFYVFFRRNMIMGNISSWVAPFVILLMVAHYLQSWMLAGILLGSVITLKPLLLSVAVGYGIFFVLKRDKRALLVLLTSFCVLVVTAIILQIVPGGLGLNTYYEFFTAVAPVRPLGMMTNVSNVSVLAVAMGIARNLGANIAPATMVRASLILLLAAFGAGIYLAKKSPEKHLPLDHLVYYLLLSTAVYPIVWLHYFSWLIGPAIYLLCKFSVEEENRHLLPAFLLSCFILTYDSLAWMGSLALPVIAFIGIMNAQKRPGLLHALPLQSAALPSHR